MTKRIIWIAKKDGYLGLEFILLGIKIHLARI